MFWYCVSSDLNGNTVSLKKCNKIILIKSLLKYIKPAVKTLMALINDPPQKCKPSSAVCNETLAGKSPRLAGVPPIILGNHKTVPFSLYSGKGYFGRAEGRSSSASSY